MLCRAKSRLHKLTPASDTHKSITIVTKQPYFNFSFLVMRGTSSFLDVAALVAAILLYSRLYSNREVTLAFWSLKSCPCLYQKTLIGEFTATFYGFEREKKIWLKYLTVKSDGKFNHQKVYMHESSHKSGRNFWWLGKAIDGHLKPLQTNCCRKINCIIQFSAIHLSVTVLAAFLHFSLTPTSKQLLCKIKDQTVQLKSIQRKEKFLQHYMPGSFNFVFHFLVKVTKNPKISHHFQAKYRFFVQKINNQDSWFYSLWSLWQKTNIEKWNKPDNNW